MSPRSDDALDAKYLDRPEQWAALARKLRMAGGFGLDTEFYGLDVRRESTVGRSRIHVWSVAIRTGRESPLGFHVCRGWVLPAAALSHPALVAALEDDGIDKWIHNQPVDDHSMANHGIALGGAINTLDWARWQWPELVRGGGFGLKNLMSEKLGRAPVCEFDDVVTYEELERRVVQVEKKLTVCACGEAKCRKRKGHPKERRTVIVDRVKEKMVTKKYPLESILPGHERWELLVDYAMEDAVAAAEVAELLETTEAPAPFPYAPSMEDLKRKDYMVQRPEFNQSVCDSLVKMERVGIPIDRRWAGEQAGKAAADAAKELRWLRKWYDANLTHELSVDEVDAIWSSPKKICELFDEMEFPRSPVWKKGRVKPGQAKFDATALEWIARNAPESAQLIKHLLHLKRIRSNLKYLVKMRDCDGLVHPICGPAGDGDDRNGAVTGRIGIKGVLETQQLPTQEHLDLYQIRRGIVAEVSA